MAACSLAYAWSQCTSRRGGGGEAMEEALVVVEEEEEEQEEDCDVVSNGVHWPLRDVAAPSLPLLSRRGCGSCSDDESAVEDRV
jgi:hypothetical protein